MRLVKCALMSGIAGSAMLAGLATQAAAQEGDAAVTPEEDIVVVTGQRGSIVNSLDEKKNSESVTDILSADQVGRFPDPNVAEALARIPGISFQRENDTGQGEFISIRGLDASYGRVVVLVVVGLVSRSMSSSRGTTIADDDDAWETTNAWRRHHVVSYHHWDE